MTFHDIEKRFDSLWLEDCVNSLYENGVKDDILDLMYRLNQRAETVVRTPFGETDPFVVNNLVRQSAILGPILNNCSLDPICKEGKSYQNGNIQLKPLKFVGDIADPSDGYLLVLHILTYTDDVPDLYCTLSLVLKRRLICTAHPSSYCT